MTVMKKEIEECAKILFERHNPDIDISSVVGEKLMNGFVIDFELISQYYNITRKDKSEHNKGSEAVQFEEWLEKNYTLVEPLYELFKTQQHGNK